MGRTEELSDFQRGTVIGCHISNMSVREISALLKLPRSTVSNVIVKWKRLGATTTQPRSGRPHKLSEPDRRVLESVVEKNRLSSLETLTTKFQTVSGKNISKKTVHRELHGLGYRCRTSTRPADSEEKDTEGAEDGPEAKEDKRNEAQKNKDKSSQKVVSEECPDNLGSSTSELPSVQL